MTLRDPACRPSALKCDFYIGRGSKQRVLKRCDFGNRHEVSVYGRSQAVRRYGDTLARDDELNGKVWSPSGCRLVCHCTPEQECHTDIIEHKRQFPSAYSREDPHSLAPSSSALDLHSRLPEEPDSSDGSSADVAAPPKTAGWRESGKPMEVHVSGDL